MLQAWHTVERSGPRLIQTSGSKEHELSLWSYGGCRAMRSDGSLNRFEDQRACRDLAFWPCPFILS